MNIRNIFHSLYLLLLALTVGVFAGFGVMLFRALAGLSFNLFFTGQFSWSYLSIEHPVQSIWGAGIILVPMLGGLLVIWLIDNFARDERGLSVPEVMYKVRYHEANISPSVALVKTLASAISLGSGASIGREGPTAQIGAAFSYLLVRALKLSVEEKKILVIAGVGAATAGIFNAPFAGIFFVIELFLTSVSISAILLITSATCAAIFVRNIFLPNAPIFVAYLDSPFHAASSILGYLLVSALLGILLGLASFIFIRGVYGTEDLFGRYFKNPYWRHLTAMFIVGLMLYVAMMSYGHYYIDGVSFAAIQDCLNLVLDKPWLLLLLFAGKFLATSLSLGSGASGGIFSPALFLGATLGTLTAMTLNYFFPGLELNVVVFTIAGMGGMVGGTTGAIATAIMLSFELTRSSYAVLPTMLTVIIAYLVRRKLCYDSIYTLKLTRRGIKY